ncbi:MAG: TRAP transporter large permease [Alphaproteobacteria bacterium]|nr:TRAP transporter large permease [Alphaproteobacteria bacterium]
MLGYFAIWLSLIALAMPVAFSLAFMGIAWLFIEGQSITQAAQRLIGGIDSFPLLAVPCFVLAGIAMNAGGVSVRIYDFARALVGHLTGGLGHVNVIGSVIFSGMSGSAIADAGGLGILEVKAMKEDGYKASFAGALTCASCIIGPLIPPSIPMVLYGVISNTSVGALFLAGVVPGLLTAAMLMIHVYFYARGRPELARHRRAGLRELWLAFRRAFLALLTPLIIMGGIFGGIFTPTEAAAVAAIYALALGLFIYGDLKLSDLPRVFKEAVNTSAVVGFIVAGASLFGWVLARERVPQAIAEAFLGLSTDPLVILVIINLVMLVLGCFMEGIAIMILMVPVFLPVIQQVGIDPVHFGVVVTMNLMIGILTPPFGVALFTVAKVGRIPFEDLAREILPFLPGLILVLFALTYFPSLSMTLPRLVYG